MTLRFSANLGHLWPGLPILERIDAAAAQLGTQRVVTALQAVAQETRDVCHTPLTLG